MPQQKAKAMDDETLIRRPSDTPASEPKQSKTPVEDQQETTACGLTRAELRAIVAEIIG